MFRSKAFIILSHLLGLLFFFSIPVIFLGQQMSGQDLAEVLGTWQFWGFCGFYVFLFYFNSYWLIPRLFLRKKYWAYAGVMVLLFTGVYLLKPFDQLVSYLSRRSDSPVMVSRPPQPVAGDQAVFGRCPPPAPGPRPAIPPGNHNVAVDIVSLFLFVMVVALNLAVETSRQWRTTQKRALQAEADKTQAELSFLKAQINPHFLFNTLNNIYSLVVTHHEGAGPAILKLSNIMRYVTAEVNADYVPLQNEVSCIRDYIALQRLRLSKKVDLDFAVSGSLENKFIAPLMLITFIENVFKYGISNHEPAPITIHLQVQDNKIVFFCQNKIFPNRASLEQTGVGIANTRERLRHLYPDKHHLDISTDDGLFTVRLELVVSC
jgi:two-component system, LytTR family, sensor kinase